MINKFKSTERVKRPIDVYNFNKGYKYGVVIKKYSEYSKVIQPKIFYPELYKVQWDDGTIGKGYLPHGLSHIN